MSILVQRTRNLEYYTNNSFGLKQWTWEKYLGPRHELKQLISWSATAICKKPRTKIKISSLWRLDALPGRLLATCPRVCWCGAGHGGREAGKESQWRKLERTTVSSWAALARSLPWSLLISLPMPNGKSLGVCIPGLGTLSHLGGRPLHSLPPH